MLRYNRGSLNKVWEPSPKPEKLTTDSSFLSPCSDCTLHYLSFRILHAHFTPHVTISSRISCHTCLRCLSHMSCICDCHTYYIFLKHFLHYIRIFPTHVSHIPHIMFCVPLTNCFLVCNPSFLMVPANSHEINPNGTARESSSQRLHH